MSELDDLMKILGRQSIPADYLGNSLGRAGLVGRPSGVTSAIMKEATSALRQAQIDAAIEKYGLDYVMKYEAATGTIPPVETGTNNAGRKAEFRQGKRDRINRKYGVKPQSKSAPLDYQSGNLRRKMYNPTGLRQPILDDIVRNDISARQGGAMRREFLGSQPPPIPRSVGSSTPPPIPREAMTNPKVSKAAREAVKAAEKVEKTKLQVAKQRAKILGKKVGGGLKKPRGLFAPSGLLRGLPAGYAGASIGGKIGDAIADWTDGETWYDPILRTGGSIAGGLAGSAASAVPFVGTGLSLIGAGMMAADAFDLAANLMESDDPEEQAKGLKLLEEAKEKEKQEKEDKMIAKRVAKNIPSSLDQALEVLVNSAQRESNITRENLLRARNQDEITNEVIDTILG